MGFKSEGRNIVGATILLVKAKPFEKWSCSQIKYRVAAWPVRFRDNLNHVKVCRLV